MKYFYAAALDFSWETSYISSEGNGKGIGSERRNGTDRMPRTRKEVQMMVLSVLLVAAAVYYMMCVDAQPRQRVRAVRSA